MGGSSLDAETGETAAVGILNSLSKRKKVNGLEGYSVSGDGEEEGRRRSRLTPRLWQTVGRWRWGRWETGGAGGGKLSRGEGWRWAARSSPQKVQFSARHTHLAIHMQGFFLSEMWLAVSMKVQSINPEKVRGKLNMQSEISLQ